MYQTNQPSEKKYIINLTIGVVTVEIFLQVCPSLRPFKFKGLLLDKRPKKWPKNHGAKIVKSRGCFFMAVIGGRDHPLVKDKLLKIGLPNRKVVFQPSIFRGQLLVSGRVSNQSLG